MQSSEGIDRTVLPIPDAPFHGKIGQTYLDSTPEKLKLITPPAGAPNVLLILLDDAGYGQTATFGAPIPTPTLDRLAAGGLRYTRFHVAALCSPTRAALLTGRNHHSVGMGTITNYSTSYPGYNGWIPKSAAFVSETLRQNGYATAAFGKWHIVPDWESGPTGPFDRWPTHQGFEYYYGFIGGQMNQWTPNLFEGEKPMEMEIPPGRKADYTLNEALADKAIAWIDAEKSVTPARPFFVYYAPGATHAPLQAPKEWIEKFKGKFDMGWDKYREIVFGQQKKLGVIPGDAKLTPRPKEIPAWDSLSANQKKVAARLMEVFAGFMAQSDHEIGRVIDAIQQTGQLDNTLIFYIAGDNGASLEGNIYGYFDLMAAVNGLQEDDDLLVKRLDEFGGPNSYPHYPAGWAWAGNTPFQWGKQIASYFGATRDPLVVYWPRQIKSGGEIRTQFHHVIDIAPTILEAAGLPQPREVDGVAQKAIEGVSMLYSFSAPSAGERRATQYFEMYANRAIYHDGWVAADWTGRPPFMRHWEGGINQQPWQLYHVENDYSEADDLASQNPAKLKELQDLFTAEANKYQVFPLDPRSGERADPNLRPSLTQGRKQFVYYSGAGHLLSSLAPNTLNRSYTITAYVTIPTGRAEGVLVAQGGLTDGFTLFMKSGKPIFTYRYFNGKLSSIRGPKALLAGPAVIRLEFVYDGGGIGKGATASLFVNGMKVGEARIPETVAVNYSFDETFDTGQDTGTPVGEYAAPFKFTGSIQRIEIDTAPQNLTANDRKKLEERLAAIEAVKQ
ncbi:MAG: arylsulfatase [Candidatus Acidiferrales bacterium]